ncbi:MAG: hypothetical protein J6U10_08835 [Lachnospiraceae bacterium]|nr:hypothetical protein [Lachnospiraceae bacterium]MBP5184783.1 hypothetical protein [Lachnospiraceae bacterium]
MNYINNNPEANTRALAFTDPEALEDYLKTQTPDIIICDATTRPVFDTCPTAAKFVLNDDEPANSKMSRFTGAKDLLGNIRKEYFTLHEPVRNTERIVGFYSVFDDGSTEIKAKEFAKSCGAGTLLVSFSPFFGAGEELDAQKTAESEKKAKPAGRRNALSELLFALTGIEKPVLSDFTVPLDGYDAIYGVSYVQDLDDLATAHAEKLCRLLEKSDYQRIVIDLGAVHGFTPTVAAFCNSLLVDKREQGVYEARARELSSEYERAGYRRASDQLREAYGW